MNVLIYGCGQLAQMMYLAACPLGITVRAVDVDNECVVHPISKDTLTLSLEDAIQQADAISVEFEHIPEHLLALAQKTGKLMPSMDAVLAGADRVREKTLLDTLAVANAEHAIVSELSQLDEVVEKLGLPLILKASRDGYDGYGQWRLKTLESLPELKDELQTLDLSAVPLVVEKMVPFDRELSLVGVRNVKGEIAFYPLAENTHHEGQLHVSIAPAPDSDARLQAQAEKAFTAIANAFKYVGVMAVEFFQVGETLLVNEIAPRVHNSGHWTMAGADTSQFENHIRAVAGLPLGSTEGKTLSAMLNIIGCDHFSRELLSVPRTQLHLYGKKVRAKRKMGHINITADSYTKLGKKLKKVAEYLPVEHFPRIQNEANKLIEIKG
ncbi:5-(carboxyamino)imidazole ribonucleotide synthase [Aestuariibacter sp. AA17]|uniref:N5-carboxyaminoimidazole ribonucleotide synthase n=1 Tax=Fluctibacter corallii TaxID=2984329 RepID=A0ABT3A6S8_9ALTE|nr:5-(carboxyamino)imidazole ribonucleotide synthase [Aestuariibacter sp. AA17]MCV2884315.1 5-(carboxyamino)imidazole ribonucleotide synthase [Aestuariibacter sp. AA17]